MCFYWVQYYTVQQTKKHLTQRIQNVDDKMAEQNKLTRQIKDDVCFDHLFSFLSLFSFRETAHSENVLSKIVGMKGDDCGLNFQKLLRKILRVQSWFLSCKTDSCMFYNYILTF